MARQQSSLHTQGFSSPATVPVTWVAYDLTLLADTELKFSTPGGAVQAPSTDITNFPWIRATNLGANEWQVDFFADQTNAEADTSAQGGGTRYVHAAGTYNAIP